MLARAALLLLLLLPGCAAAGETLRVGPGERFRLPSEAAAAARDGDRVLIAPGRYRDCAVWRAARLTIAAAGEGAVEIHGPVCEGKALFVVAGPGVLIEGLTFRGAVAPPGNGAGIRAEGGDLTIRRSRFEDNETGLLTRAEMPQARLVVEDSAFIGNGRRLPQGCGGHGFYAGHWALVSIRRSRFEATRACHHVKSRAARTEVVDSVIADGPEEEASYLLDIPNGGDLLLAGSTLVKGPRSGNFGTAVMIGAEGVARPTHSLRVLGNRFENRQLLPTIFVHNRSGVPAELEGNTLRGLVLPLLGPGMVR
ncbi:right-handed parallel beta-helix repeat-containing protein [Crenalkalicoccus roseus]|uniref:hypothetical protein n=1 Tax=Crenalkalicoccus roseus TaxID=1485588 RepID=UPI001081FDBE|nr:hypothetical protein [Crenalkalicoccus roseus]